ncbi:hypothetical protein EMCRGX_G011695 [Ephydatia muelleri]
MSRQAPSTRSYAQIDKKELVVLEQPNRLMQTICLGYLHVFHIRKQWSEVVTMDETTTDRTVDELHAIFARWGIPLQMVTDNGPQFTSAGFKLFPGLEQHTCNTPHYSPYHPATKCLVECLVQISTQALKRDEHRSHTGNIDDGGGSTMQTQSSEARREGINVLKCQICLQLLNAFVMLETELWLEITGLVILGGKQPQLGSKSCKVEIDGGGVWKRHADQMTTTGFGNGIEDEPASMAVEPEWRLDRQVPEVLPDSSDTEPGDMPGKLTSVNSTSPLAPIEKPTHYLDTSELSRSAAVERICDVGNGVMVRDYRSGHSRWQTATIGQQVMQGGINGGEVRKRQADQMTATGVGNGIEDEPVSMAVEPEWRLDRQGDSADQSYP